MNVRRNCSINGGTINNELFIVPVIIDIVSEASEFLLKGQFKKTRRSISLLGDINAHNIIIGRSVQRRFGFILVNKDDNIRILLRL